MLTVLFVLLKSCTRRGYVKLDNDVTVLFQAIERLKQAKRERQTQKEQKHSDIELVGTSGAESSSGNDSSPEPNHQQRVV